MIAWSRKYTWIAGLTILVLTNVIALGGVAYNRSGEPDATLRLTERELRLSYSAGIRRENSGISLTINWRMPPTMANEHRDYSSRWSTVEWLNATKLDALGFETEGAAAATPEFRSRINRGLSREAWLVLEYDGLAYQVVRERVRAFYEKEQELATKNPASDEFVKRAGRAKKRWEVEQHGASRLFVVDAGLDPALLRKQYPDKAHYIVARGQIRAAVNKDADGKWGVQGYIRGLAVASVHVPLAFRDVFAASLEEPSRKNEDSPRFSVTLAYGKRGEPWVVSAEKKKH